MRLSAVITLIIALALPATADAAKRKVPQGWLGVVVDGPLVESGLVDGPAEWDRMAGSGVEAVRTAFYWPVIQPTGPTDANYAPTDAVVLDAARRGLGVLPVVVLTPDWARVNGPDPSSPPRNPADYARLMTMLVARYGPTGSLWAEHPEIARRPIRAWQIWNEPNLTRYWNVAPWAPSYVRLVKAAKKALRKADPHAKTVLAGLPNESWEALDQIYDAKARGAFDVVALHPYTGKPKNVVKILKIVRRRMQDRGDRKLPIWVTELSWPAALGKTKQAGDFTTTDAGQARRLESGLKRLAADRRKLRVERVYWYSWLTVEGASADAFRWSGLRRMRDGRLIDAPALSTFERMAKRLQGCAKRPGNARACR
jgi:hypothetical protein